MRPLGPFSHFASSHRGSTEGTSLCLVTKGLALQVEIKWHLQETVKRKKAGQNLLTMGQFGFVISSFLLAGVSKLFLYRVSQYTSCGSQATVSMGSTAFGHHGTKAPWDIMTAGSRLTWLICIKLYFQMMLTLEIPIIFLYFQTLLWFLFDYI